MKFLAATTLGLLAAQQAAAQFQPGFQIEVRFAGNPSAEERAAFDDAAARWSEVIVGDIRDVTFSRRRSFNCGGRRTFNVGDTLDDLIIYAAIEPIDGVGRVLGSAGPCVNDREGFPRLGQMRFDSADVAQLIASGDFANVILHEMGHVIGIGTSASWRRNNRNFEYVGAGGRRGYELIGGVGNPPIEDEFGPGTRGGHWDEAELQNELMTGFLGAAGADGNPLSALTIGALQDQGYAINLEAADDFTVPTTAARSGDAIELGDDVMIAETTYTIDFTGGIVEELDPDQVLKQDEPFAQKDSPATVGVGAFAAVAAVAGVAVSALAVLTLRRPKVSTAQSPAPAPMQEEV